MNEHIHSLAVNASKKRAALIFGCASLRDYRLAQRVVAAYEELVPLGQAFEVLDRRHTRELSAFSAVALWARQHEVPHAVDVNARER